MFILAFFGFLRCSELTISSSFDHTIHPTISDLAVLDDETISYIIKQSKTDQTKKGHFIYIFNLQSPILPYQTLLAFLHLRKSQSKLPSDPLLQTTPTAPSLASGSKSTSRQSCSYQVPQLKTFPAIHSE